MTAIPDRSAILRATFVVGRFFQGIDSLVAQLIEQACYTYARVKEPSSEYLKEGAVGNAAASARVGPPNMDP